ncbi:MAG: class II aldolase/adducin family protein [Candidatus Edwardsbacteria bacterium]
MKNNSILLRNELVKICHKLQAKGLVVATDGNVSVRLDEQRFLITPSGLAKGKLSTKDLVIMNLEGKILEGKNKPSSEIKMHLFIYKSRKDINAIVHAHPPIATGFAVAGIALTKPVLPEILLTVGKIPLAKYATPSTEEVPKSLKKLIKKHQTILLANHGAITLGKDLQDAYYKMERLEYFALVSLVAHLLGKERTLSAEEIKKLTAIVI